MLYIFLSVIIICGTAVYSQLLYYKSKSVPVAPKPIITPEEVNLLYNLSKQVVDQAAQISHLNLKLGLKTEKVR
jgi:hypothetical protein